MSRKEEPNEYYKHRRRYEERINPSKGKKMKQETTTQKGRILKQLSKSVSKGFKKRPRLIAILAAASLSAGMIHNAGTIEEKADNDTNVTYIDKDNILTPEEQENLKSLFDIANDSSVLESDIFRDLMGSEKSSELIAFASSNIDELNTIQERAVINLAYGISKYEKTQDPVAAQSIIDNSPILNELLNVQLKNEFGYKNNLFAKNNAIYTLESRDYYGKKITSLTGKEKGKDPKVILTTHYEGQEKPGVPSKLVEIANVGELVSGYKKFPDFSNKTDEEIRVYMESLPAKVAAIEDYADLVVELNGKEFEIVEKDGRSVVKTVDLENGTEEYSKPAEKLPKQEELIREARKKYNDRIIEEENDKYGELEENYKKELDKRKKDMENAWKNGATPDYSYSKEGDQVNWSDKKGSGNDKDARENDDDFER